MYSEHSKIRQTTEPEHRAQYSARGEKSVESQAHLADYYAITDPKGQRTPKSKKSSSKKGEKKRHCSKKKKKTVSFAVGSAEHHATSLQKLQLAVGDKNKQKVALMLETQRLKDENGLMLLQILLPRDNKEAEYIKELGQKDQRLKVLELVHE